MTPADFVICDVVAGGGDACSDADGSAGIESSAYHNGDGPRDRLDGVQNEVGHPPVGMAGALEEERGVTNAFISLDDAQGGEVWV
jgi:hypothetical protein